MRRESETEGKGENITDIAQLMRMKAGRTRKRAVAFLNIMSKDKGAHASKNKISKLTENNRTRKTKLKISIIAF